MTNLHLVYPMFAYVFYMFLIGVLSFYTRVNAAVTGKVDFKYFKALQGEAPHHLVNIGRHYDNQFELPLLFFITCLTHMIVGKTNQTTISLSWAFIATRLAHTFFHLVGNKVPRRAFAFALGWFVVIAMWIQLVSLLP
jgi:hypothetical protein